MLVLFISTSKLMLTLHAWLAGLSRKGVWNNIHVCMLCKIPRMTEAKMWHGMDICNTSTTHMCSVLSRYVIVYMYLYMYQLIDDVLLFVFVIYFVLAAEKSEREHQSSESKKS